MNRAPRSGAILVFVLVAVATIASLALFAGAAAARRSRIAADAMLRSELRDEAASALALAAARISADTNGVDHLAEDWARGYKFGRAAVQVEDEKSRLHFPQATPAAFAALFTATTGTDPKAAQLQAEKLVAWRTLRASSPLPETGATTPASDIQTATNAVWRAEEELLASPAQSPAPARAWMPHLTAHGDGRVNINTAPREVFLALSAAAGAPPATADAVFRRISESRKTGDYFAALTPSEAARLLSRGAAAPTGAELAALRAMQPLLCVESGLFRLTARAEAGAISQTIQCAYDRASGKILRWIDVSN